MARGGKEICSCVYCARVRDKCTPCPQWCSDAAVSVHHHGCKLPKGEKKGLGGVEASGRGVHQSVDVHWEAWKGIVPLEAKFLPNFPSRAVRGDAMLPPGASV